MQAPKYVEPMFLMALMWSIGGTTTSAGRVTFDQFLRAKMKDAKSDIVFPAQGLVYDFMYDFETGEWKRWLSTIPQYVISSNIDFSQVRLSSQSASSSYENVQKCKAPRVQTHPLLYPSVQDYSSIIVPTGSTVCYASLLDTLLTGNKHTIIVGETGVGKSVVASQKLTLEMDAKYDPILMAFSAQTSANQTQDILDGKLEKRRQASHACFMQGKDHRDLLISSSYPLRNSTLLIVMLP